eukprot:GILJ01034708.1.p1 GENE.GILJ01034708.1~~GILJ01034708.1.p1  ORF type:complete len:152 (+),score=21.81 GILJ01034708.1:387-842(+)
MATIDNTSNTETTPTTPKAPTSQPSSNTTTTAPLFEARVVGKPNATVASIAAAISLFKGVLGASESNAADGTTTVQAFFFTEGDRSAFISSVSSGHVSAVAFAAAVADDPGNDDGDSGASLPTWAIAVIAVGGTLVVGIVIGLVYRLTPRP